MEALFNNVVVRNEFVFLPENVWSKKETMNKNKPVKLRMHEREREDEMLILQGATYLALRHF